ncbi:FAD-binding oxidoreductase [Streptomyces sp. TRM76323]|uniref:FAD-binding oxidoreductase n=1 Tax=Streptomyces tamarix TaxID=3078565 RepID=A0ABU3QR04_9ACTN|nr:FAD-binding oxidoreductase [Streptomyces tamarix]MDT9685216.1 FAD-binding oxidoreductase [Streptomyces tamarix]
MDRRALLTTGLTTGLTTALAATAGCAGPGPADPRPAPSSPLSPSVPSAPPSPSSSASPPGSPAPSTGAGRAPSWKALAEGLDGLLVLPGDEAYATARQLYNRRFDGLRPAAVAYPAGEEDVRECLAFARRHGIRVAARNGGHSYGGWSSGDGRLVVDVSRLAGVEADGGSGAVVGAGARLVSVYRALAARGRTVPAGSCPTVGVTGLTLGGGHGVVSRAYGLTCDSLEAATLVTADGRTVRASAEEEPDLLWALRGGGLAGFGVVTGLRFRTHPAPPTVTAYLGWPWPRARAVLAAWQEWGPDQPDEVWSQLHLSAGAGGGTPSVTVTALTLGGRGDLEDALDRLVDRVGAPAPSVALRERGFLEAMLAFAGCADLTDEQCRLPGSLPGRSPRGALGRETYTALSDFFDRPLPRAAQAALTTAVESFARTTVEEGGGGGSVALTALGGAVNRVAPSATAFVHRRSRMLAQYNASWRPGTPGTAQERWLRRTRDAMRRYASGRAYQNYPDPALAGWRRAYYGEAADRLAALRGRYDPAGLFAHTQSP